MATKNDSKSLEKTPVQEVAASELSGFVSNASARTYAQRLAANEIEAAEQIMTLEKGQEITGILEDSGRTMIEDINTKQMKEVTTWKIRLHHPDTWERGPLVSILGSAQLDRQLPALMGLAVIIARGDTIKTKKGANMTEYAVFCDKVRTAQLAAANKQIPATTGGQ